MIHIYADGSCSGNPGPGGWGVVIVDERRDKKSYSGGPIPDTTNQRMEIKAAIEGLSRVQPGAEVTLYSDSQYVIFTMTRGWKRRVNTDLWENLDKLVSQRKVGFEWIRGHVGHPLQEEADKLANRRAGIEEKPATPAPVSPGAAPPSGSADEGKRLSHLDEQGRARMVDISAKPDTERVSTAKGRVLMAPATLALVRAGNAPKGDVLSVARLAGIMAAKRTAELIPLCHPLALTEVAVDFSLDDSASAVEITATAKTTGKTGVEMEALTAVAVAALTIYDMAKAVDRRMRIDQVRLVHKSGGKSGEIVLE